MPKIMFQVVPLIFKCVESFIFNFPSCSTSFNQLNNVVFGDGNVGYEPTLLERIEALESQITDLQKDLEEHSHTYLTGKGTGHNNTEAETGPATFPATP